MAVVTEKYGQTEVEVKEELDYPKFYRLPKLYFQIDVRSDYDYINGVKESIRFFSLDLPPEIKEIYIPFNEAPVFWIYESSLLSQLEEFMRFNLVKGTYGELHKSIKENYSKWVTTKLKSEKDYYATLTINFIERDINKLNVFNMIIKAIIYTYQSSFYNPLKALSILSETLELMNTIRLNEQTKTELRYILNLYTGFVHLKENNQEKAKKAFKKAIEVKPQGSTAKIYCALTELNLNNREAVKFLLKEVFNYDVYRLAMALKTDNSGMFSYFYRNAFIYNIFREKDFVKAYDIIEKMLNDFRTSDSNGLDLSRQKIEMLKEKKMDEHYDESINNSIMFFEKIIQSYSNSQNTLLIALTPEFHAKFNSLTASIVDRVRAKYYMEISEKTSIYDIKISENSAAEKHLLDELEKFKIKSKDNLEVSLRNIRENFDIDQRAVEQQIDNLPNIDRFNPRVSLSNNMTYNIIIAFIVFIIGGFTGYSNKTVSDASELNSVFSFILLSGSKWGAISFLLGTVISAILSLVILLERSDMKYKLVRKLNYLQLERERIIADIKVNSAHKEKMMSDTMNSSINNHRKTIQDLTAQKEEIERTMMQEAESKIKAISSELESIV